MDPTLTDPSLSPDFSSLSSGTSLDALSAGFDASTVPVANSTNSQSSTPTSINTAMSFLTSLFDGGAAAYNNLAQTTGLPLLNGQPTAYVAPAIAAPAVWGGLTTPQLQLIGGGIAVIALLFLLKRR